CDQLTELLVCPAVGYLNWTITGITSLVLSLFTNAVTFIQNCYQALPDFPKGELWTNMSGVDEVIDNGNGVEYVNSSLQSLCNCVKELCGNPESWGKINELCDLPDGL